MQGTFDFHNHTTTFFTFTSILVHSKGTYCTTSSINCTAAMCDPGSELRLLLSCASKVKNSVCTELV